MRKYITIDGGTTNTRISLVIDKQAVETVKLSVGARNGIDNKSQYKNSIKEAIEYLIKDHKDIKKILASGMITSEFGLYELPHTVTPVGIRELNALKEEVKMPEISDIPFVFMRGVKTDIKTLEDADMMRGEETELFGLCDEIKPNCIYVLPGSHSKIIQIDEQGRISEFYTMLTGEMIAALSQNTILKDSVDLSVKNVDEEYLKKGYDYCGENGINEALFKVRILKNLFKCNPIQIYSFFIGVVLYGEIQKLLSLNSNGFIIGGREQIKDAMYILMKQQTDKEIIKLSSQQVDNSTISGMIKIYEYSLAEKADFK